MIRKYAVDDCYHLGDDDKQPSASYKDYEYKEHEVSTEEACQWREIYKLLYGERIWNTDQTRVVKSIHVTNLLMWCGVKPTDVCMITRTDKVTMMRYKDFYLNQGDVYYLHELLVNGDINKLAELLSTMKGKQTVRDFNGNVGVKILEFGFYCEVEETMGEQNEN